MLLFSSKSEPSKGEANSSIVHKTLDLDRWIFSVKQLRFLVHWKGSHTDFEDIVPWCLIWVHIYSVDFNS